jgi:prolyl oligopeptidase
MIPDYPAAPRGDDADDLHGEHVADPYRWLENADSEQTQAWSTAQDELFGAHQSRWPRRDAFRARVAELMGVGGVATPRRRGDRLFVARRAAGAEHWAYLCVEADGTERVLLDPMVLDPSGKTVVDFIEPSPAGDLLAYALSEGGTEESVVSVLDVATGEVVDGPIDRAWITSLAWLPDGKSFYLVRHLPREDKPDRTGYLYRRVYLHRLGADPDTDVEIAGAEDVEGRYFGVDVSPDGRWLVMSHQQGTDPRNEMRAADLRLSPPESPAFTVIQSIQLDADSGVYVRGELAYIFTNLDAPRGRLCVTTPDRLDHQDWRDLLAEDPVAVLVGFAILDSPALERKVVLASRLRHAVAELTVHDLSTGELLDTVELPSLGSVEGLRTSLVDSDEAWFLYSDFGREDRVYRYDGHTGTVAEVARPAGSVDVGELPVRQVTYTSKDGTEVRMFVIGSTSDGPRPTILYGYGGFQIGFTPWFSADILSWVEAGGVYAIANLRGGNEEGEQWHRAGMLGRKQNVFDDFHAAAQWLLDNGITTPERLCLSGGSNGGLLMGASVTQFPSLMAGVICSAPLLDMVRYEQFGLGMTWSGEYGTAADAEQFGWLYAYSPYHRVRPDVAYPSVLFTTFDGDTRVDPMHARKMCSALQHATTGEGPILLRRESDVGHGDRAVSRRVDLSADQLAFAAHTTGLS